MIKKLRVRFIVLAMSSLMFLLIVIVGSSNLLSYQKLVENADSILSTLAENAGKFPEFDTPDMPKPDKGKPFPKGISAETPYESRYFTVKVSENGEVLSTNTDRIVAIDEDDATKMAQEVWNKGKRGFSGNFRYAIKEDGEDTLLIFLDCERNLTTFQTGLLFNCLLSLAGLAVVFVILSLLSKRIVKPVADSYEKQKQFISIAGHEIRTPLTIIDADTEVLLMDIGENEWIQDIRNQTKRLAALTNDLICLSRMDENKAQFQMIDFPLSDMVAETVQSFQVLAKNAGLTFQTDIQPMLSYFGDSTALRQLVGILLDNAIKYAGDKGSVKLTLEKKNYTTTLSVLNTSSPVTQEQMEHFFDRFYRTEQSRNSETGGYGLGLSIAKSIVTAHKGKITASAPTEQSVLITVTLHGKGVDVIKA